MKTKNLSEKLISLINKEEIAKALNAKFEEANSSISKEDYTEAFLDGFHVGLEEGKIITINLLTELMKEAKTTN